MKAKVLGSILLGCLLPAAVLAIATPFNYDGDLLPNQNGPGGKNYADWFTTIGPGGPAGYWPTTAWSSDGDVLTMTTAYGAGIWFGRGEWYGDFPGFNFAGTGDGNLIRTVVKLSPGATEWSLYWYDASGYGSSFNFYSNGFDYTWRNPVTLAYETAFHAVASMTSFHTYTSYILAGQVSYFFDGAYLGGGTGLAGLSNFMVFGDGSGSTPTGTGSMLVDGVKVITAVSTDARNIAIADAPKVTHPAGVPDTGSSLLMLCGGLALLITASRSRRRPGAVN